MSRERYLVVAVLAFVQTNGPIGAVARLAGALAAALAVLLPGGKNHRTILQPQNLRCRRRLDHFYSRFLRGACVQAWSV